MDLRESSEPRARARARSDALLTRVEPSNNSGTALRGLQSPPLTSTDVPLKIGRYTVLRRVGQGAMGVVYAAYDDELDRRVAIKLLLSRPKDGSMGRARLRREAQALAKLSHPNVVQVYETGSHNDQIYLVMEYIKGVSLRDWLCDAKPSWREIIEMFIETGKGLAAAHHVGLIHRDFKPVNVLVGDDGRPRVLDFGLARASVLSSPNDSPPRGSAESGSELFCKSSSLSLSMELTQAGTLLGTPAYMSPEQLFLTDIDVRCDIYSFAVSLWEALYGARPYKAKSVHGLRAQVSEGPPALPKGPAPVAVGRTLLRGLAFDRDHRYATMELFLESLAAAVNVRRKLAIIVSVVFAFVVIIAATYFAAQGGDSPAQRCADAGEFDDTWSPAIAESIEHAVLSVDVSYGAATWVNAPPSQLRWSTRASPERVTAALSLLR